MGSKLLPASTRFKLGTRLRTNGQSGPGDASSVPAAIGCDRAEAEHKELLKALAFRGYNVSLPTGKDGRSITPSHILQSTAVEGLSHST